MLECEMSEKKMCFFYSFFHVLTLPKMGGVSVSSPIC